MRPPSKLNVPPLLTVIASVSVVMEPPPAESVTVTLPLIVRALLTVLPFKSSVIVLLTVTALVAVELLSNLTVSPVRASVRAVASVV